MTKRVGLHEIKVRDRARTDLGDLTDLMASIEELGLLQPIVITEDHELIAGGRRLEACRKLGMTDIEVTIAEHLTDAVDLLKAEQDENTCRKDMTVSERLAIAARIEEMKRPEAEQRMKAGVAQPSSTAGAGWKRDRKQETAALAAEAIGMSRSTYYLVKAVKKHADDAAQPEEIREAATEALADMDATGRFSPAYDTFVAKAKSLKRRPTHQRSETDEAPSAPPLKNAYGRRYPQRSQRKAITEGIAALSGLCAGLASVNDLDDSINAEEVALWQSDLNQALRVLRSLNNTFKEHINGKR